MTTERQLFHESFARAKAEGREHATLLRTMPIQDPLEVYRLVCRYPGASCIMESATQEGTKGRFSYVCMNGSDYTALKEEKHLGWLKEMLRRDCPPAHPTLPFVGGAVGYLSHELTMLVEDTVPLHPIDPFNLPLGKLHFFAQAIIFDHQMQEMHHATNVRITNKTEDVAYQEGCGQLREMERMTLQNLNAQEECPFIGQVASNMTREEYHEMVRRGKKHIAAGDVFQVVLSQRFQAPYRSDIPGRQGLALYAKLRELNPSPNMFHMCFGASMDYLTLLGASPEIAVHIENREMRIRPIAGTRKRGATAAEDQRLAHELQNDPKELAEHRMLVDLARNDIGRFCKADSITIPELMEVEPYSHVMHLTSEVKGVLRDGVHPLDAALGSLPPGTLSGAPKVRALQLIAELEKSQRGPYGGAFGWMTDQAIKTCIFIRSAMLHREMLYWQSGGGIVADSEPEAEYQESLAKARAIETALQKVRKHWTNHESRQETSSRCY